MSVDPINATHAPAIHFVRNCLGQREKVVIYPEPDSFEDFTLRAALMGVTADADVMVGELLVDVWVTPNKVDHPYAFLPNGEALPCAAMHTIPLLVHPEAGAWVLAFEDEPWTLKQATRRLPILQERLEAEGWQADTLALQLMWVTRHPTTAAPDGSEPWDVTVSIEELVELDDVLTELQQSSPAANVLPMLATILNQGSWTTLDVEMAVELPQWLLRNVRRHHIMDESRETQSVNDRLRDLTNQVLAYAEGNDVPRAVKKLLKRTSRRLNGLLETAEMTGRR